MNFIKESGGNWGLLIWSDKGIINRTAQSGSDPFSTDINFHLIFQLIGRSGYSEGQGLLPCPAKIAVSAARIDAGHLASA